MELQKESWEDLLSTLKCPQCKIVLSNCVELKNFISQERLLAQKEFGERLLDKKYEADTIDNSTFYIVSVEDIEAEIKELGV